MHIGYLIDIFHPFMAREAAALKSKGVEVTFFHAGEGAGHESLPPDTFRGNPALNTSAAIVRIVRNPMSAYWTLLRAPGIASTALHELRAGYFAEKAERLGIGHLHGTSAGLAAEFAALVSALTRVPYSFTAHGSDIFLHNPGLRDKLRHCSAVRATSDFVARELRERYPANARLVQVIRPAAPDIASITPKAPAKRVRVLAAGPLESRSGFDLVIEAAHELKRRGRPVDVTIAGTGPLKGDLERHLSLRDIAGCVRLQTESAPDFPALLLSADIAVLPCRRGRHGDMETVPEFLLAAVAAGVPAVSTLLSAIPELLENDRTGKLVTPEDSGALADAIDELAGDPLLRDLLAKAARRELDKRFNPAIQTDALVRFFEAAGAVPLDGDAGSR